MHALIPMGLPAIIFGGILGGIVTPTEAAAVAVLYAGVVGLVVYREIKWSDLPRILIDSAVITASVCFLLGVAAVVAWMLAVAQVPAQLLAGMKAMSAGPIAFLILTALLFILLGAILEGLPAVIILLPTFLPVVKQLNIDLVHFSIVVVAATFLVPAPRRLRAARGGVDRHRHLRHLRRLVAADPLAGLADAKMYTRWLDRRHALPHPLHRRAAPTTRTSASRSDVDSFIITTMSLSIRLLSQAATLVSFIDHPVGPVARLHHPRHGRGDSRASWSGW